MRRAAKWIGGVFAGLLALPVLLLLALNTAAGQRVVERLTPRLTGDTVRLTGMSGRFPDALRVGRIELRDAHGDYATINDLALDWSPLQLLHRRIVIDRLEASHVAAIRMPAGSSSSSSGLPAPVVLRELKVARLDVGAALAGTDVAVALDGSGELASPTDFNGTLTVRQVDGAGSYALDAHSDAARLRVGVRGGEPVHGLIAGLAGVPELGAVSLDATLDGPRNALATRVVLAAGQLNATANGTLDLERAAADLTLSATAPAMQPRPDVGWQSVALNAHLTGPFTQPTATGHLAIDTLSVAGASIHRLTADIDGDAGRVRLSGEVAGLRVPGPNADLLANDPLVIQADARLDAVDRPVHVMLRHPLFTVDADALTGSRRSLDASLRLADLAPFAAMGHVQVVGGMAMSLHAATEGDTTTVAADGTVGVTGGQPQASALVGDDGRFSVAATVRGDDLMLSKLNFIGRAASLEASGSVAANRVDMVWTLAVSDLAAAEPRLGGELRAEGKVSGATDDLTLTADIGGSVAAQGMSSGALTVRIEATGLPSHPGGRITARGALLDAPVDLAVVLRQVSDGLAIDIERAAWKSLDAGGSLRLPTATMVPLGDVHLAMTRLADLAPLIGRPIGGSVRAALTAAPGVGSQPVLDAKVDAEGVQFGKIIGGTVHATASGPTDALDVKLTAALPDLGGAAARLTAAARVDAAGQTVTVASLQGDWRQQTVRLLAPVRIGFSDGIAIDRLRLGLRQGEIDVTGRAGTTLDLTASLRNLPADLVAVIAPDYAADGTVQAEARITGTAARPTGRVHVTATGLRVRGGPARAIPPAGITADADLYGTDARIDVRVTAGKSRLTVAGRAPLGAAGALDLRAGGALDLAMLDPILAAGGRRVRGQVTLDATITGTVAAPAVTGTARLSGGEVQDYTVGLHLTDVVGRVQGNGAELRIVQLSAKAGQGTIGATGSIGVMAPDLPVDLTITARKAQPLASDLITAVLDADLTLRGAALGQLAVGGAVHVRRADVRIPERMPATVATLPVRQPGARPAPPAPTLVVTLALTLDAQQVFIRGRGLEAEFQGAMKLGGTLSAPRTEGGLELRRGSISLAGRSLDFTEGRISFDGGSVTDPSIHLVATSTSGNVVATLAIDGTAHEPKITLSSVPPLPQDEVLAHLLFGSGTGKLGALEIASIAAGLATLTGAGGGVGDPLDKVRQGLGLDRLAVRNGANGSPTLEAGRYIAPRVYLGAKQGASGGAQATVQVDITKGLKLEATTGSGGGSATGSSSSSNGSTVGVTYQFEY